MYNQILVDKGDKNENKLGALGSGRLNKMLRPRFKNGFVISIVLARAKLIVRDASARSAFCSLNLNDFCC